MWQLSKAFIESCQLFGWWHLHHPSPVPQKDMFAMMEAKAGLRSTLRISWPSQGTKFIYVTEMFPFIGLFCKFLHLCKTTENPMKQKDLSLLGPRIKQEIKECLWQKHPAWNMFSSNCSYINPECSPKETRLKECQHWSSRAVDWVQLSKVPHH